MTRSARKGISREARALRGMMRWHLGGGAALDGLMMARWEAGKAVDKVDTVASVLLALDGRRSSSLDRWATVLGLEA